MSVFEKQIVVKHTRFGVAPRKVRQVCDLIRQKKASEALKILRFCQKRETALALTKLINTGLAIALESESHDIDNIVVKTLWVDEGPMQKRFRPRSKGRACPIRKRTSHIVLGLMEV